MSETERDQSCDQVQVVDDGSQSETELTTDPARHRSTSTELPPLSPPISSSQSPSTTILAAPDADDTSKLPLPDPDAKEAVSMAAHPYAPLLNCPACVPPSRLRSPTTLHCGHTVCASHLHLHPPAQSSSSAPAASSSKLCPLPSCRAAPFQPALAPNIPRQAGVQYFHPPSVVPLPDHDYLGINSEGPRIDVLVGKVLDLVGLMERGANDSRERVVAEENSDGTDGTSDEDGSDRDEPEHQSGSRDESISASNTSRRHRRTRRPKHYPHKRIRRELRQSPRSRTALDEEDGTLDFLKELNETLTCDICSSLLYQPVTTPCQHVSVHAQVLSNFIIHFIAFVQTFCAKCLQRTLDHGTACPICRQKLPTYSYFQDHPLNKVVLALRELPCY